MGSKLEFGSVVVKDSKKLHTHPFPNLTFSLKTERWIGGGVSETFPSNLILIYFLSRRLPAYEVKEIIILERD